MNQNQKFARMLLKKCDLKVKIVEFVDDWQPGWLKCTFQDIYQKEWTIIEKVPVITSKDLDKNSSYPIDESIACTIIARNQNDLGENIVTIDLSRPWGISEEKGQCVFDVFENQITEEYSN